MIGITCRHDNYRAPGRLLLASGLGLARGQPLAAYRIGADGASRAAAFPHKRRDFYKVKLLLEADGILHYGDQQVRVLGDALLLLNPHLPHSW